MDEVSMSYSTSDEKKRGRERKPRFDPGYVVNKRQPSQRIKKENEVYVTNKSNFKAQLNKCSKLFEKGEREVVLHGLGKALPRTINLALQLQSSLSGSYLIDVSTNTLDLIDDLEPLTDDGEFGTQTRSNSVIAIRIYKESEK